MSNVQVFPSPVLPLPVPAGLGWPGAVAVDLHPLYLAALAVPQFGGLRCQAACTQGLLQTNLMPQHGQAMVLELGRFGIMGTVGYTTPNNLSWTVNILCTGRLLPASAGTSSR